MDLRNLLGRDGWLPDLDHDGFADDVAVGIVLTDKMAPAVYSAAGLLAARLGLEVAALTLPLCFADSERVERGWRIIVGEGNRQWPKAAPPPTQFGRIRLSGRDLLLQGDDQQLAQALNYLAIHYPEVGASSGTSLGELLDKLEGVLGRPVSCYELQLLPRATRLVLQADGGWSRADLGLAKACLPEADMTTSGYDLLVTLVADWAAGDCGEVAPKDVACLSQLFGLNGIYLDRDGDCLPDELAGSLAVPAVDLATAVAAVNFAARVGLETLGMTLRPASPAATPLISQSAGVAGEGRLQLASGHLEMGAGQETAPAIWTYLAEQYPRTPIGRTWTEVLLQLESWVRDRPLGGEWQDVPLEWEVDELLRVWAQITASAVAPLRAEVRVSEPLSVRRELQRRLEQLACEQGLREVEVRVRSAYKQGLEWIREEAIPALLALSTPIDSCRISVAAFHAEDALDPAARWLLELYPVDLLLCKELRLSPEQVTLQLVEDQPSTYCLQALAAGTMVYEQTFSVWQSETPYLHCLGARPTVHPPTGGVSFRHAGGSGFIPVATDLERVFAAYQGVVLPELLAGIEQAGALTTERQPFFERLHLQVSVSEPEERLGVREELLSPADALHEDLHFVGLDLFKRLGEARGQQLRSPGLILPEVAVCPGQAPGFRYRLSPCSELQAVSRPTVQAISFGQQGRISGACIRWAATNRATAEQIAMALAGHGTSDDGLKLSVQIVFPGGELTVECRMGWPEAPVGEPAGGVIYLEQCRERLLALGSRPGAAVEVAGVSRQGRPIYAAALTSSLAGSLISSTKMAGWKPTYLINNRHHANEVSSTTAALDLLDQLQQSETGQQMLRRINVVAIPLENVDGAASHERLARENPNHKLHAARFNSLGREFADAYFRDDDRVPEAKAFTDLWRKYVPDIVADCHGIPSHEWEQPFSGYLCPWFSSFWIPRSLFYAYFWYVDAPTLPSQAVATALERAITGGLTQQPSIRQRNRSLLASWHRYFLPYLPDHFAGEERSGLMWYYVPFGPDSVRNLASHHYPKLTVLDYTTEVADETAQGEYLSLCADTHRLSQSACLEWLARQPQTLLTENQVSSAGVRYLCRRRQRPLQFDL